MCFNKGNSNITVLEGIEYFMSKTKAKRKDVYYNGDKLEGRMGGLYKLNVVLLEVDNNNNTLMKEFMSYDFDHLVVDDNLSYCLPFIDPGPNWCVLLLCVVGTYLLFLI